jgi:hypothetical protein
LTALLAPKQKSQRHRQFHSLSSTPEAWHLDHAQPFYSLFSVPRM